MERTNFTKNICNMHKNLLKHSKKRREEKPQSLVKTIPNWLKMSQSAKGGWKEKIVKTFGQDLFSVDSGANNMVYDINLINWTNPTILNKDLAKRYIPDMAYKWNVYSNMAMIFNFNIRVEHHLAFITIDHSHGLFIFFVRSFAVIFDLSIRVELHLEFITFELWQILFNFFVRSFFVAF